jgi:Winged helix-turn helix
VARGRRTQLRVVLTDVEREELERWQRLLTQEHGSVRRGRIILLVAAGQPLTDVARTVGISRRFVYKWVRRFQAQGLAGLESQRSPGRPRRRRAVLY